MKSLHSVELYKKTVWFLATTDDIWHSMTLEPDGFYYSNHNKENRHKHNVARAEELMRLHADDPPDNRQTCPNCGPRP